MDKLMTEVQAHVYSPRFVLICKLPSLQSLGHTRERHDGHGPTGLTMQVPVDVLFEVFTRFDSLHLQQSLNPGC